jgi:DHA1 family tetracycline resistance protein-like MFS transporter
METSSAEAAPMPTQPAGRSNRSALLIVFIVVFIDLLGFGIVLPLLPRIADQYVVHLLPQVENRKVVEGGVLGLLMASFSLMQFLFAPIWGRLSDRIGRRPILLLGLAGSAVFYFVLGFACHLPRDMAQTAVLLFFVARIGAGLAGATIGTAQAVIADCTPPDKRKHGMALIGAAFGIGFTFGPLFGYGALHWYPDHLEAVGYTASGLSLLALVLGMWLLPETRQFDAEPPLPRRGWNIGPMLAALGDRAIGPVILTFFLATLGFAGFEVTLALFLKDAMGYTPDHTLLVFAYVGFTLLITQGFLYRRLAKRLSEVAFMTIGILFMAVGVGSLSIVCFDSYQEKLKNRPQMIASSVGQLSAPEVTPLSALGPMSVEKPYQGHFYLLFTALTAAVVGFAFLTPSAQALISRRTEAGRQGEVLGINQSASALARILGPIIGIPLYKATESHILPYIFGSLLLLLMLPLIPRIRQGAKAPG